MNGIELKKLLKLNYLSQETAAELFNVKRETVNRWCKSTKDLPEKTHNLVMSKLRITDPNFSLINENGVQLIGKNNGNIDNRQYYSDSPDVLKAQIDLLDERIKEKDAQIKEKDAQIKEKDAQIKEKDAQIKETPLNFRDPLHRTTASVVVHIPIFVEIEKMFAVVRVSNNVAIIVDRSSDLDRQC